jgi:hypothetical protein
MWIFVESGIEQGTAAEITNQVLIGSAATSDLSVRGRDVSPRHALVRVAGGTLTLADLGTPAGTFLNGERLSGTRVVGPGDRIRIGEATLGITLDAPTPKPATAPPVPPAPPATGEPPGRRRGMVVAGVIIVLLVSGVAVALAVGGGSKTPATPKPDEPQITSFTASAASPIAVELAWAATGGGISEFTISRDGTTLVTLPAESRTYQDTTARPRKHYQYAIELTTSKNKHANSVTSEITMPPPPPLKEARLSGRFDVNMVFLSENYENKHVGQKEYGVWAIKPKCAQGPCRVGVRTFAPGQTPTVLGRIGTTYRGKGTDLFSACRSNNNRIRTNVAIDVKVIAARYIRGAWRATQFSGILSRSAPAAFGCLSASSRLSVKGRLQAT